MGGVAGRETDETGWKMKKLSIAALIIGAFVFYSFLHAQSTGAVLDPKTLADAATAVTSPTAPAAGTTAGTATTSAAADPPSPTAATTAAEAQPTATNTPTPQPTPTTPGGHFKNGSYTGTVADAQWGYVQVKAVISGGKITNVQFLQYPNDRSRSVYINSIADPELTSEAVQAQSAQVDIITGATDSSYAFIQSLSDALSHAQA